MNELHEPTAAAKEASARWAAGWDYKEEGCFNLNKYPAGSLERSAYIAEAQKIAHANGELL